MKDNRFLRQTLIFGIVFLLSCSSDKKFNPADANSDGNGEDTNEQDIRQDIADDTTHEINPPCTSLPDSDGDTIADIYETTADIDNDTIPNDHDADSDNDTITDAVEGGNGGDTCKAPVDSDGDTIADFIDPDSDNDGVSDSDENAYGTDRLNEDTDGDSVSDLIETVYGSDPLDPTDNPRTHGDFVFLVDYMQPPVPPQDTLVFGTDLKMADVYFMIDSSGSMTGEIDNLRTTLSTTIAPGIFDTIPDVQMGVMRFEDCPEASCEHNLVNLQNITDDLSLVQSALDSITDPCGGEEPYAIALWIVATGNATAYSLPDRTCPEPSYIGYPCFRPGAIPIIIQIGDEPFEWRFIGGNCRSEKSRDEVITALRTIHAKYIGIDSCEDPFSMSCPKQDMEHVAFYTGSIDADGNLLVYKINPDGTGLGSQIVEAVVHLANQVPISVSAEAHDRIDGPEDVVDASVFIERIIPNTAGGIPDPADPGRICAGGLSVGDIDGDTIADHFSAVLPGTIVCFDIIAKENDFVPRKPNQPQLYTADIFVMGEWITILDSRIVYFLVPPEVVVEGPI